MLQKVLNYLVSLMTQKRHKVSLNEIKHPITLSNVEVHSLFRRDRTEVTIFESPKQTISIVPLQPSPERIDLFRSSGRQGLRVFYYRDNVEKIYIANGSNFIHIGRDEIFNVRKAFRTFTRTARPLLDKKPGKPFKEYEEPVERA